MILADNCFRKHCKTPANGSAFLHGIGKGREQEVSDEPAFTKSPMSLTPHKVINIRANELLNIHEGPVCIPKAKGNVNLLNLGCAIRC